MSRDLIQLETHLSQALLGALNHLAEEASGTGRSMYVTGSTMRDVIAGLQAQELVLVVEGEPGKLAVAVPPGLPVHLTMSAVEQPSKKGGRAKLVPATIHEYLRTRDFSVNAIALAVTRSSRGLLIDPMNGVADIAARELRALSGQTFLTQPVRMLELLRLKVKLGFAASPRTQAQFDEALEAGAHRQIKPADLKAELERVASERKAVEVLEE
jgi:tRNA nucleotidyltransferase (CCA-adding enzyme)